MASNFESALEYARLGLVVIPLRPPVLHDPTSGKAPLTSRGYRDGTTEAAIIRDRFRLNPTAGVGIVTGRQSNVIVLDVDPRNGGRDTLNELQNDLGSLPRTWTVETGGGGIHQYFELPKFDLTKDNAGRLLGPGIDVSVDGGYVVAPPSKHASGRSYRWRDGLAPEQIELAALPPKWLKRLQQNAKPHVTSVAIDRDLADTLIREGTRNVNLTAIAGEMRYKGRNVSEIADALKVVNAKRCAPPLGDAEIVKIATSVASYPPSRPASTTGDQARDLANALLERDYAGGAHLLWLPSRQFWGYNHWHWGPIAEDWLKKQLLELIDRQPRVSALLRDAVEILKATCAAQGDPLAFTADPSSVINCKNGELWLGTDGSVTLKQHSATSYLRQHLNVVYDPKAKCAEYDDALLKIFSKAEDPQAMADFWDEVVAYALQPTRPHAIIVIPWGSGRNGKTRLLQLLIVLLGMDQVYAGRVEELDHDRFAVGSLLGALAFIDDDIKANIKLPDGTLKKLSEEKIVTGEKKFRDKFTFKTRIVPFLACNSVPLLSDLSYGMRRRLRIVPFEHRFTGSNDDPFLFKRIAEKELSGVLNRALEGWRRLARRGNFDELPEMVRAKRRWLAQAHPLPAFLDEACKRTPGAKCLVAELYAAYCRWAADAGHKTVQRRGDFKRDLERQGYRVVHGNRGLEVLGLRLA